MGIFDKLFGKFRNNKIDENNVDEIENNEVENNKDTNPWELSEKQTQEQKEKNDARDRETKLKETRAGQLNRVLKKEVLAYKNWNKDDVINTVLSNDFKEVVLSDFDMMILQTIHEKFYNRKEISEEEKEYLTGDENIIVDIIDSVKEEAAIQKGNFGNGTVEEYAKELIEKGYIKTYMVQEKQNNKSDSKDAEISV